MSFGKARRELNENSNYNPPPGYYTSTPFKEQEDPQLNFPRSPRFHEVNKNINTPGPGAYHSNKNTKKRLLEQHKKRQERDDFKINSIPSIPKQSTAGIYEQLAPGILVMHQTEQEMIAIGPGSYEPKPILKKVQAHKFNPEHQKKFIELIPDGPFEAEKELQKLRDAARQQRRVLQARQLVKKSPAQSLMSPTDVCLQLIILREKQLKATEVPAPGYYHNERNASSFQLDGKPSELQCLAGKAERFPEVRQDQVGPGKYQTAKEMKISYGGFIPKSMRRGIQQQHSMDVPGPGTYVVESNQKEPQAAATKYPAIFGSGCARFMSASASKQPSPGPGAYAVVATNWRRRPKTINIRNIEGSTQQPTVDMIGQTKNLMISPQNMETEIVTTTKGGRNVSVQNSSFFCSSLQRFNEPKPSNVGPGKYDLAGYLTNKTFNKRQSLMSAQERFEHGKVRPRVGPGSYQPKQDLIRTKKTHNVKFI